jgi:hypothetical protein
VRGFPEIFNRELSLPTNYSLGEKPSGPSVFSKR